MITDVLIRNFKCFRSLNVPELGRITLIGGRNNVGKTALLEALFLFLDRARIDRILRQYGWRGIEGVISTPEAMWAPIFYNYDMNHEIIISTTIDGKPETAKFSYNPQFVPPAPTTTIPLEERQISTDEKPVTSFSLDIEYCNNETKKQISHLFIDSQGQLALHIDYARISGHPSHFFPSKKHIASKQTADEFSKLAKEGRESEAIDFLRIIEPRLETLKIITEGPVSSVHGKLEGFSHSFPIHFMGEGMEKLLNLLVGMVYSKGGCVFVDEMENGLHYSALPAIWKAIGQAICKYDCQIITTTHSYECLQAAHEGLSEMPEDFRYIRLHRKDDEISSKLSNYDMIGTALKTNLEVR